VTSRQVTVGVLLWGIVIVLVTLFIIITEQSDDYDVPVGPKRTVIVTTTVMPEDWERTSGEGT